MMAKDATQREAVREPQLKAAVIDALFAHCWIDADTVVVSEMPLPRGDRRADLVLANGKLIGFEIKSFADTTVRLSAQASAFLDQFEGLVVVVDERHYNDAERMLPPAAGIFTSHNRNGRVEIEFRRKAHIRALNRAASVRLMHATDLRRLARDHGLSLTSTSRYGVEKVIEALPDHILRKGALDSVKRRYRAFFEAYRNNRAAGSDLSGLDLLRKPAWRGPVSSPVPKDAASTEPTTAEVLGPLRVTPRAVSQTHRRAPLVR
jgi:hypothetical protein